MAAGGSAPELFTSFIGTMEVTWLLESNLLHVAAVFQHPLSSVFFCVQESSVGFGTIVGSAVSAFY